MRPALLGVLLVGCGEPEPELTACEGGGDIVSVAIGRGGVDAFQPWDDGRDVTLYESAGWGFQVELQTEGLDTREAVSVIARFTLDGESESQDAAATITLQCEGEGPGWAGMFVPLDSADQTEAAVDELVGQSFTLRVSVVDAAEDSAEHEGNYVFAR